MEIFYNENNFVCYKVNITHEMKIKCLAFAVDIILSDNQYSRLDKSDKRDEIERTYMGKLGEMAFLSLLHEKGKKVEVDDTFKIIPGQHNVDKYDFKTVDNKTVDVKTGYKPFHRKLAVNLEQLQKNPKNYYVGVLLNSVKAELNNKLMDLNSVTKAKIYGYATRTQIAWRTDDEKMKNAPAKSIPCDELEDIDKLLEKF